MRFDFTRLINYGVKYGNRLQMENDATHNEDTLLHFIDDASAQTKAGKLNQHCVCATLDRSEVVSRLAKQLGDNADEVLSSAAWHHFFSDTAVFVPAQELDQMMAITRALEAATELPEFRHRVLSRATYNAQLNPGPVGAFMGYDFHLGEEGPRLIEVNTNAGGAFLNAQLARAHAVELLRWPGPKTLMRRSYRSLRVNSVIRGGVGGQKA